MKFVAFILSFYLIFLVLIPCSDEFANSPNIEFSIEKHSHTHEFELCSPFCACDCCHIPVHLELFQISLPQIQPYSPVVVLRKLKIIPVLFNIWKPPKNFLA